MAQGQITSYTNTQPQKRMVTDRIIMSDPFDIVTLNVLGLHSESKFRFANTPGRIYEWLEDTYASVSDTATASGLNSDSTTTTFSAADGSKFQPGDVVMFDSDTEVVWVSAVSTNTVTIVRNKGGSQATHSATAVAYIRGRARLEGDGADDSPYTLVTTGYNYSQILQKTIEVSRTDGRLPMYGIGNVVEREIDKAMKENLMLLSKLPYYGVRQAGSATTPRMAGGLPVFITTNATSASSAALTQKMLEDEMQDCFSAGGNPRLILCGAWAKRKIADFYSGYVRTERSERAGGISIDKILSPLGIELDVVVDRHCPAASLFILDPDYVGFITLDDFFYEELAKTKDTSGYGEVVGEYGFVAANEKMHSIISAISTSS